MEVRNLSFKYGSKLVVNNISFSIAEGEITTLIGANGSGKTTLLHLMTKNLKPFSGGVYLEGKNIQKIRLKEFSKKVAIVHQYNTVPNDVDVKTVVGYGRIPHKSFYKSRNADEEIVNWAMDVTGVSGLKDQYVAALSGGEKQRAWIAMALSQKTNMLLLDEPTTYLDIRYQIEILNLVKYLNESFGITILMILHDINQAIHYSDDIIGLKEGNVVAQGKTQEVINSQTLRHIYDIDLEVFERNSSKYVLAV